MIFKKKAIQTTSSAAKNYLLNTICFRFSCKEKTKKQSEIKQQFKLCWTHSQRAVRQFSSLFASFYNLLAPATELKAQHCHWWWTFCHQPTWAWPTMKNVLAIRPLVEVEPGPKRSKSFVCRNCAQKIALKIRSLNSAHRTWSFARECGATVIEFTHTFLALCMKKHLQIWNFCMYSSFRVHFRLNDN